MVLWPFLSCGFSIKYIHSLTAGETRHEAARKSLKVVSLETVETERPSGRRKVATDKLSRRADMTLRQHISQSTMFHVVKIRMASRL